MAKAEAAKPAEGTEAATPAAAPKKSKKLLIIAGAVALVLVLGGGAAFLFLAKGHSAEDEEVAAESDKPKKKSGKEAQPIYVALEPFTVNLVPEQGDQYLQVGVSVDLDDAAAQEKIKLYMPKLRNDVMLLLASKRPSELSSKEGKEQLASELREKMNRILNPDAKDAKGPVKEVLFTSFIIQ